MRSWPWLMLGSGVCSGLALDGDASSPSRCRELFLLALAARSPTIPHPARRSRALLLATGAVELRQGVMLVPQALGGDDFCIVGQPSLGFDFSLSVESWFDEFDTVPM